MSTLPPALHHETFYYHDGSLNLRAENTLYNVYQHTLQQKSQFFASLLSLPGNSASEAQKAMENNSDFQARQAFAKANGLDGKCDEKVLLLPHTVSEVDELFGFIYNQHDWSTKRPELGSLCSILKLSIFYIVDTARDYAIHHLSDHPELRPALRLHLACQYNIIEWVGLAFQKLMEVSILTVTEADQDLIGNIPFRILVRTHAKVAIHRQRVAFGPPDPIHDTDCLDHSDCDTTWKKAWWGAVDRPGILTALLHPETPVKGSVIDDSLEELRVDWGMSDACRLLTIGSIRGTPEKPSRLRTEEQIVARAVARLIGLM